jgi:PAS domain S-box-containing protein
LWQNLSNFPDVRSNSVFAIVQACLMTGSEGHSPGIDLRSLWQMTGTNRVGRFQVVRPSLRNLLVFEISFFIAYGLGMSWLGMSFAQAIAAPFWFPDSVLLCTLLITQPGTWWLYVLGCLPIRLLFFVPPGTPVWFLAACFANDSLKALLSAWLLREVSRPARWLDSDGAFTQYFLIAVVLSPMLSAVGGAASRVYLGDDFVGAWRNWFLGNALTSLVLTPLLVCVVIKPPGFWEWHNKRLIAVALFIFVGLTVGGYFAFHLGTSDDGYSPFLLYIPVPFLLAASVLWGPIGASFSLLLTSLLAIFETAAGRGPFLQQSPAKSLLSIQLFMFFVSLPFMFLSVLIGQQRKTDASLRESEHRFRSLVNAAPVMVWMSDTDARCTFFNKPWFDFTGRSPQSELENGWAESLHPEDRGNCTSQYLSAFHSRSSFVLEHRLLCNDGTYRWVLDHGIPRYGSDGGFLGYIGSCIDITDRKDAEDRLRQVSGQLINAEEAERSRIGQELHDDLAQRAATFSLRLGYIARTSNKDELKAKLDTLREEAVDLCQNIANISHRLRPAELERLGLVRALRNLCQLSTSDRQTVAWMGEEGLPGLSNELSITLYRIAQEALRNASKHSAASEVYVQLSGSKAEVILSIRDTGRGFNVSSSGMSGLGLSGMAERMRNIGGRLNILSSPGNGTTVIATAPIAKVKKANN